MEELFKTAYSNLTLGFIKDQANKQDFFKAKLLVQFLLHCTYSPEQEAEIKNFIIDLNGGN